MKLLITGGAGFIGSAVIRLLIDNSDYQILNLDKLSYSGNPESLYTIQDSDRYKFIKGDICDKKLISKIFKNFQPDFVMHLAAESHVDRSIDGPTEFIQTNIFGTYVMLECANQYFQNLSTLEKKKKFCFHHISTDEVYGSLDKLGLFTEKSAYNPSSPYSASKASSDHLVRAWYKTYNLPVMITNCSNNYGPYQFPEKLIPLMITNAIEGKSLPVYGDGKQIRDWLFVEDHASALFNVINKGEIGETYNIGGNNEKTNLEVIHSICDLLQEMRPNPPKGISLYSDLITHVYDRPGHDIRYAIDSSKIKKKLNWKPEYTFNSGLRKTVEWYLNNLSWYQNIKNSSYLDQRLGSYGKNRGLI